MGLNAPVADSMITPHDALTFLVGFFVGFLFLMLLGEVGRNDNDDE